jgi:hypothetical protein
MVTAVGAVLGVASTLMLVTHPTIIGMVRAPLSESPTWVLVPVVLLLAVHARTHRTLVVAAALTGLMLATRFQQGIGLAILLICGVVALWERELSDRRSWRPTVISAAAALAAIALLPAVHNLHYGGRFRVAPDSSQFEANVPLPPSKALRICCDRSVRNTFVDQLRGVAAFGDVAPGIGARPALAFGAIAVMLQLVWLASLLVLARRWRQVSVTTRLVALLPLAFLLPQIFLAVYVYYPRHIVIGYLVMGLAAAFVFGELSRLDDRVARGDEVEAREPPRSQRLAEAMARRASELTRRVGRRGRPAQH